MTELSERLVKAKAALFGGAEADWKEASSAIDEAITVIRSAATLRGALQAIDLMPRYEGELVGDWIESLLARYHRALDLAEAALCKVEVDRILSLPDEKILAEARARGDDPEAIADRYRAMVSATRSSADGRS